MISSIFTEHRSEKSKYPYFGRSKEARYIVLFTKPDGGTVLSTVRDRPTYDIGFYSEEWDEESFEPVRGILSIEAN